MLTAMSDVSFMQTLDATDNPRRHHWIHGGSYAKGMYMFQAVKIMAKTTINKVSTINSLMEVSQQLVKEP